MFDPNGGFVYLVVSAVISSIVAVSVFFLVRAWRQARRLGINGKVLGRVVGSSVAFTIVPSISILMGVIALAKALGIAIPWLRLSVIGSLSYETTAAAAAASAFGYDLSHPINDPRIFNAIVWSMSIGTLPGFLIVPIFGRRIENGVNKIGNRDMRWGEIFITSLFVGMISVFVGLQFTGVEKGIAGWIPVFVLLISAFVMAGCTLLSRLPGWKWVESYALPVSMLGSMALSIPITAMANSVAG